MHACSRIALPALVAAALAAAYWLGGGSPGLMAADAIKQKGPIVFCIEGFHVANLAADKKSYQCKSAVFKCGEGFAPPVLPGIAAGRAEYSCIIPAG